MKKTPKTLVWKSWSFNLLIKISSCGNGLLEVRFLSSNERDLKPLKKPWLWDQFLENVKSQVRKGERAWKRSYLFKMSLLISRFNPWIINFHVKHEGSSEFFVFLILALGFGLLKRPVVIFALINLSINSIYLPYKTHEETYNFVLLVPTTFKCKLHHDFDLQFFGSDRTNWNQRKWLFWKFSKQCWRYR